MNIKNNSTLTKVTSKIETFLKNRAGIHINTNGNVMIGKRVFSVIRKSNPELLVLLSSELHNIDEPQVWGHIFKDQERGMYIAAIVKLKKRFNPLNINLMFNHFWYYIGEVGCWYPAKGEACAFGTDLEEITDKLCCLIESLEKDHEADNDIRLVALYPFPNPFKKPRPFNRWLKQENRNV